LSCRRFPGGRQRNRHLGQEIPCASRSSLRPRLCLSWRKPMTDAPSTKSGGRPGSAQLICDEWIAKNGGLDASDVSGWKTWSMKAAGSHGYMRICCWWY